MHVMNKLLLPAVCLLIFGVLGGCRPLRDERDAARIADRLAILNVLGAYPHHFDEGEAEDFLDLFTEDVTFEWYMAGEKVGGMEGRKAFGDMIAPRMKMFAEQGLIRRHTNANIFIVSQTEKEAHVRMGFILHSVKDMKELTLVSTGTYEGRLVKLDGRWLISHWIDRVDLDIRPKNTADAGDGAANGVRIRAGRSRLRQSEAHDLGYGDIGPYGSTIVSLSGMFDELGSRAQAETTTKEASLWRESS